MPDIVEQLQAEAVFKASSPAGYAELIRLLIEDSGTSSLFTEMLYTYAGWVACGIEVEIEISREESRAQREWSRIDAGLRVHLAVSNGEIPEIEKKLEALREKENRIAEQCKTLYRSFPRHVRSLIDKAEKAAGGVRHLYLPTYSRSEPMDIWDQLVKDVEDSTRYLRV